MKPQVFKVLLVLHFGAILVQSQGKMLKEAQSQGQGKELKGAAVGGGTSSRPCSGA